MPCAKQIERLSAVNGGGLVGSTPYFRTKEQYIIMHVYIGLRLPTALPPPQSSGLDENASLWRPNPGFFIFSKRPFLLRQPPHPCPCPHKKTDTSWIRSAFT